MKTSALITAIFFSALTLSNSYAKISIPDAENIINEFTYTYKNAVIKDGKKYVVNKKWNEKSFDISIKSSIDNTVSLLVTKGVIDNKRMTEDSFRLILCHEFGHYFGGAPKKSDQRWASSEGQADYYSTAKCIKRIIPRNENLVERVKKAALSLAQMLAEMNKEDPNKISLDAKDSSEVFSMDTTHPSAQCRLDTVMAGLRCPISEYTDFSNTNPDTGACLETSTNDEIASGARPRCWYRPKVVGKLCQTKELVPGQKMSLINITIKKYKDDHTAELAGLFGIAIPANKLVQKVKRLNNNQRFESFDQKIVIDRNVLYIDQATLKTYLQKSLLPIKLDRLNLKSQGSNFLLNVSCKDL